MTNPTNSALHMMEGQRDAASGEVKGYEHYAAIREGHRNAAEAAWFTAIPNIEPRRAFQAGFDAGYNTRDEALALAAPEAAVAAPERRITEADAGSALIRAMDDLGLNKRLRADIVAAYVRQIASLASRQEAPVASGKPIDMVLHCPKCGLQHIDAPPWKSKPHRLHMCHDCNHIWRPADVPTNGVQALKTASKNDSPIASPSGVFASCEAARWNAVVHLAHELDDAAQHITERQAYDFATQFRILAGLDSEAAANNAAQPCASLAAPKTALQHFAYEVEASGEAEKHAAPCSNCDDSGDVTSITGEWRGVCYCPAGQAIKARMPAAAAPHFAIPPSTDVATLQRELNDAYEGLARERGIAKELAAVLKDAAWRIDDIRDMLMKQNGRGDRIYGCDEWSTPTVNLAIAHKVITAALAKVQS